MNSYENLDIDSDEVYRGIEDPKRNHTGSKCVRNRFYRAVCLVVLCVLLLTAVIVLCVLVNTNNHQFNNINNITEERDQLLTKYINITEERDQLQTNNIKLTEEKDQLLTNNTKLTEERDELRVKYSNITKLAEQLNREKTELWTHLYDGWIYSQFSLYFISSELKNWTESRKYCRERGADLIIINNREEQDLLQKMSGADKIWIGLSDDDVEGRWKWVDNSTLTVSFWKPGQPNSYGGNEDCAETHSTGWNDCSCYEARKWICEKNV